MTVDFLAIGIQTGLMVAILAGFLLVFRVRGMKWIEMAFVRWMKKLSATAEEEGTGVPGTATSSGTLNLGGFKIDPQLIQLAVEYGPKLMELAKQFGLIKGGTGGTGGYIRP